jgi:predicted TIM-barrel fold metal-dependent hydrolase
MEPTMPRIISVDDHVVEPAHIWESRLPARYRERAPRVVRDWVGVGNIAGGRFNFEIGAADGVPGDIWVFEDLKVPMTRVLAAVGFEREDMSIAPITFEEMRPGCYEPAARIADMKMNGVEASLCFPNMFVRFCGQTFAEAKDKELGLECVKAYNDWMIEEWCGDSGGALIPLCIIPMWDPILAAAEVRRTADRGCRAICFSEAPYHLGLPSIHSRAWDPLFATCEETQTVICMHIGSSSKMPTTSDDAPAGVATTLTFMNAAASLSDWLMSGNFLRFPALQICFSESQFGWVPYLLERVDSAWLTARGYNEVYGVIPEPPSTYFHSNVYVTFYDDRHGMESLATIGDDRVLFETDYPHTDGTWPETPEVFARLVEGLPPSTIEKVARGNAIKMLHLGA